jgi:hypothetical protein
MIGGRGVIDGCITARTSHGLPDWNSITAHPTGFVAMWL